MDAPYLNTNFYPSPKLVPQHRGETTDIPIRSGNVVEIWASTNERQVYEGRLFQNNIHDKGNYIWKRDSEKVTYEGDTYVNHLCGYGVLSLSKGGTFEGLFKESRRFGPGVETHPDGSQDVGLWGGTSLLRICHCLNDSLVPRLAKTADGKTMLLRRRHIVDIDSENEAASYPQRLLKDLGANDEMLAKSSILYAEHVRDERSAFFDQKAYDLVVFGTDPKLTIDVALTEDEIHAKELEVEKQFKKDHQAWEEAMKIIVGKQSAVSLSGDYDWTIHSDGCTARLSEDEESSELLFDYTYSEPTLTGESYFKTRDDLDLKEPQMPPISKVKKVLVRQLIAWNNNEQSVEMLIHTFRYRNAEKEMLFCVQDILAGRRIGFKRPGALERHSMEFLDACVYGDVTIASRLVEDIYPSVCDVRGNGAVMLSAVRDDLQMLDFLIEEEADLDYINDEGFSPLTMSITRYLAIQYDVRVWEKAFLLTLLEKKEGIEARYSLMKMRQTDGTLCMDRLYGTLNAPENSEISFTSQELLEDEASECDMERPILLSADKMQPIILPAFCLSQISDEGLLAELFQKEKYLFDLTRPTLLQIKEKTKKGKMAKRGKGKKKTKEKVEIIEIPEKTAEEIEKETNLEVVLNTINKLLSEGADPDNSNVPLPALLLCLFTKSVKLLKDILDAKADPNVTTLIDEGGLTALHMLINMPPSDVVLTQFAVLVNYGADVNKLAYPDSRVTGRDGPPREGKVEKSECLDCGQTPLHMVCRREDTELSAVRHNRAMIHILLRHNARPDVLYMGHCALTLAIRTAQTPLVLELLTSELVDPNQKLGGDLGSPLAFMMTMRTQYKMDVATAVDLMDVLIQHGANPFDCPILYGEIKGNVVDHVAREIACLPVKPESKKAKKKRANVARKGKNVRGKGRGADKANIYRDVVSDFRDHARFYNMRHVNARILSDLIHLFKMKTTLESIRNDKLLLEVNNDIVIRSLWITSDALEKCFRLKLQLRKLHCNKKLIESILDFNQKIKYSPQYAATVAAAQRKRYLMDELGTLAKRKSAKLRPFSMDIIGPEVDENEDNYNVCFECSEKFNKTLVLCPICKIVKFCSDECREANKKRKLHICDTDIPLRNFGESDEDYFARLHIFYELHPVRWPGETDEEFANRLRMARLPGETDSEFDLRMEEMLKKERDENKKHVAQIDITGDKRKGRRHEKKGKGKKEGSEASEKKSKKSGDEVEPRGKKDSVKELEASKKAKERGKSVEFEDVAMDRIRDREEEGGGKSAEETEKIQQSDAEKREREQKTVSGKRAHDKKTFKKSKEFGDKEKSRKRDEDKEHAKPETLGTKYLDFDLSLWDFKGIDAGKILPPYAVLSNGNLYYRFFTDGPPVPGNYSLN